MRLSKRWLLRLVNLWPPYLGAGIRVRFGPELRWAEARMTLRFYNRNYFGTHFGGSLYAMVDPLAALILAEALGRDYVVWDKAASIRFVKPGRGTVRGRVELDPEWIAEVRAAADRQTKVEPELTVEVRDEAGDLVATVDKVLYVRRTRRGSEVAGDRDREAAG